MLSSSNAAAAGSSAPVPGTGVASSGAASGSKDASASAPAASVAASSALRPSASSAASSSAPSSSSSLPAQHVFDLSDFDRHSLLVSVDEWTKSQPADVAAFLLKQEPDAVMAVLVVRYADGDQVTPSLHTWLLDQAPKVNKKLAELLQLPGSWAKSHRPSSEVVAAVHKAVELHAGKYPHLTDPDAAAAPQSSPSPMLTSSSSSAEDEADDSDHREASKGTRKGGKAAATASASPRRSTRSPGRTARKQAAARPSSSARPTHASSVGRMRSSESPAKRSLLAELAGLPHAPAHLDSGKRVRLREGQPKDKKSKKHSKRGKDGKKEEAKASKRKQRSRRPTTSEEDSDSDGPDGRDDFSSDSDESESSSSSSSSSASSSSSDSDDPSSRSHRKRKHATAMEANGLARPLAKKWIRNALGSSGARGSDAITEIYKDHTFRQIRNARECQLLAKVVDCLRRRSPKVKRALEMVVRRLVGVQAADLSNNWDLCDQFELVMDKQSFVPDEFLARAIKNSTRIASMQGSKGAGEHRGAGAASSSSSGHRGAAGGGKSTRGGSRPSGRSQGGSTADSRGSHSTSTKSDKESKGSRKQ